MHIAGDGFTAGSGDYNGLSPQTWDLDFLTANTLNGDTDNPARSNHTHPNLLVDGTANQTLYWNTTSSWTPTSYLTTDLTNTKVMIGEQWSCKWHS